MPRVGGIELVRSRPRQNAYRQSSQECASRRDSWTVSMLEVAAALCAGLGATAAVLAVALPPPAPPEEITSRSWLYGFVRWRWAEEEALAQGVGWPIRGAAGLAVFQAVAAIVGGVAAGILTGLPVLAAAGAAGAVAVVRGAVASRMRSKQVLRQD